MSRHREVNRKKPVYKGRVRVGKGALSRGLEGSGTGVARSTGKGEVLEVCSTTVTEESWSI